MSVVVAPIFGFQRIFAFELGTRTGQADRQTDGRTDKARNAACEDELYAAKT